MSNFRKLKIHPIALAIWSLSIYGFSGRICWITVAATFTSTYLAALILDGLIYLYHAVKYYRQHKTLEETKWKQNG